MKNDHDRKTHVANLMVNVGPDGVIENQAYERLVAACNDVEKAQVSFAKLVDRVVNMLNTHPRTLMDVVSPLIIMNRDANDFDTLTGERKPFAGSKYL